MFSISIALFLSKQEKILAKLNVQYKYTESILESVRDSLVITDQNQKIVRVNDTTLELLGYARKDLIGKDFSLLCENSFLDKDPEESFDRHIEVSYKHRTGAEVPVSLSSSILEKDNGGKSGAVYVAQDITERKKQERLLKASLRDTVELVQEIHDRVKNNLQAMSSLICLQARHYNLPEDSEFLRGVQKRIQSVSNVHEILYQSNDLSHISASLYMRKLAASFLQSAPAYQSNYQIKLDVEDVLLETSKAIPCGLLIYELFDNCLTHAFERDKGGTMFVRFQRDDTLQKGLLFISDDGKKMSAKERLADDFSFSIKIIQIMAKQFNAEVSFENEDRSMVKLKFPLSPRLAVSA